ncbi:MAG: glycosyltransferase family 4 protein [Acidimicrobiales bacterium]
MEIHQVLVSASSGDAITASAFELRTLLRRIGPSDIYARYFDPSLVGEVYPISAYSRRCRSRRPAADLLVFHASIGEPEVLSFIHERPERLVLVYHNISPASAFQPYDPAFAGLLDSGRRELEQLRDRAAMALGVSAYNAAELVAIGFRNVRLAPLVVDVRSLVTREPDPETANHLATQVLGPVVLFVGQLLPHKRPDLLLKAYHLLVTYSVPEAHLVLVGAGRLPRYRQALQLFAQELNLRAWIAGSVTPAQLAAFYRRADVFVTASEHEGFCVPLVEAMACGVPVIARSHGAIPETLGGAGLLLPPGDDPVLMAEAMATAVTEPALRQDLVARGHRRLAAFDPDEARATVLGHLLDVA